MAGNIVKIIMKLVNDPKNKAVIGSLDKEMAGIGKAVGGIATGIGVGLFTYALSQGLQDATEKAIEQRKATEQLNAVLKSTGFAAGVSARHVEELAASLQKTTNYGDEATLSAANLLLTFKEIKGGVFDQATKTVLDMSTAMGQDLKSSALQLGKALNDPVRGIDALRRVGVQFTDQQRDMIKTLVEAGDIEQAQQIILRELNSEFGGSAEAARKADGGITALKNAFGDLEEVLGSSILDNSSGLIEDAASAISDLATTLDESKQTWRDNAEAFNLLTDAISRTSTWQSFADAAKSALGGLGDAVGRATEKIKTGFFNFTKGYQDALTQNTIYWAKTIFGEEELKQAIHDTTAEINARKDATGADMALMNAYHQYQTAALEEQQSLLTRNKDLQKLMLTIAEQRGQAEAYIARVMADEDSAAYQVSDSFKRTLKDVRHEQQQTANNLAAAYDSAATQLKSIIDSQIQPTLSEVWQPPDDALNMDEQARRLATVAKEGFNSEWLSQLDAQFRGMDFWQPIADAMDSGDDTALRNAAQNILTGSDLSKLWDKDLVIQRVKRQWEQDKMREAFAQAIAEELQGQGVNVSAADVSAQLGGGASSAAAVAAQIKNGLPDAVAGADMATTLFSALAQNIKENKEGVKAATLAMVKAMNSYLPEVIGEFQFMQALVAQVGRTYGLTVARP